MADLSQIELNNVTYDLKDTIARKDQLKLKAIINTLTDTFVDALHNHTKSFEGFAFKTVSGSIVTFDTCNLD